MSAFLLLSLVFGAFVSVCLGQDANWDLQNYHLYNGSALLAGRHERDLLAAGMQSYLNPTLDIPYAALALGPLRTYPRALSAVMGLWYGAAIFLAARLALVLYAPWPVAARAVAVAGSVSLGVSGAAMFSQVGTTTNELPIAVFVLGGLLVLLRSSAGEPPLRLHLAGFLLAGALFGLAAGFKLTAAIYAPAACLAAAAAQPRRGMLAALALVGAGWLAGFLIADGWWAAYLWNRFQSPAFPMFNGVFRTPLYPPATLVDGRFLPRGVLQWMFYPVFWLTGQAGQVAETAFRDGRMAATLALGWVVLVLAVVRRRPALSRPQRAALVFLAAAYATWLGTSSILRYAVAIEVVACLAIPLLLALLVRGRVPYGALTALVCVTALTTRYPTWGRVPYGPETLAADLGWVEPGTLFVLTFRGPVAHLVPLMPHQDTIRVLNLGNTILEGRGWPLHDEVLRRVRDHPGPIVVITYGHPGASYPELGEIGLSPELGGCRSVASTLAPTGIQACDARRAEPTPLASPFWAQAALRYRTVQQPRDPALSLIGGAYLLAAGPAARGTRFLDWSELLWSGVGADKASLPAQPDPGTLYVLSAASALRMAERLDPAADAFGRVDGRIVLAPGWRTCAPCTARPDPVRLADIADVLSQGEGRRLGPEAEASGYLAGGWWPQEPGGIWSQEVAELLVPLAADIPERVTLVLSGRAFTGPGLPAQRVRIELHGHPEAAVEHFLAGPGEIGLRVERRMLRRHEEGTHLLRVRITFPDAASPATLGVSGDTRRLGFAPDAVRLVDAAQGAANSRAE